MAITSHEAMAMKIAELEVAIKAVQPNMATLLRDIHQNLKLDPENVTLLTPAQVSVIVSGLSVQTQTTITTSILTKGKGKSLSKLGVDDI